MERCWSVALYSAHFGQNDNVQHYRRPSQDARTVNVIATALLADTPKLACTALNFFLNIDTIMADDDDEEGKAETAKAEVKSSTYAA